MGSDLYCIPQGFYSKFSLKQLSLLLCCKQRPLTGADCRQYLFFCIHSEVNVLDNNQAWFVNFYSPNCHHCHELAPTWRKLASELEGVIKIGAVNCEDDWALCYQLNIQSYPSLIYYEKEVFNQTI